MLENKNAVIRALQYDVAKVSKAHNDLIRVYEAKVGGRARFVGLLCRAVHRMVADACSCSLCVLLLVNLVTGTSICT